MRREDSLLAVYVAKGARVFVSGLTSVMIPVYLKAAGYDAFFIGLALAAILAGNALSNFILIFFERRVGAKRILQAFSIVMVLAGFMFVLSSNAVPVILACFLGNISTTGTEAGPFQSVEAGVLPELAGGRSAVTAFGKYNLIGYAASAFGAFAASLPAYLGGTLVAFREVFVGFGLVGLVLLVVYSSLEWPSRLPERPPLGTRQSRDLVRLSGLFSVDAFGGSFVSQYILSYWFSVVYGVALSVLGPIFLVSSLISAASTYGAAAIAVRLGNLRTMVYTHIPSSVFLVLIPVAGSFAAALGLLFARQSLSQMDVPARQALMSEMFEKDDRVQAYAFTNTVRSLGAAGAGPVATGLLALGALSGLLFVGGFTKIGYDLAIFGAYRKRFR